MAIRLFAALCAAVLTCTIAPQAANAQALDRILKDKNPETPRHRHNHR